MKQKKRIDDQIGATMIEYTFMVLLVLVACIAAVHFVGDQVVAIFSNPELVEAIESEGSEEPPAEEPPAE